MYEKDFKDRDALERVKAVEERATDALKGLDHASRIRTQFTHKKSKQGAAGGGGVAAVGMGMVIGGVVGGVVGWKVGWRVGGMTWKMKPPVEISADERDRFSNYQKALPESTS